MSAKSFRLLGTVTLAIFMAFGLAACGDGEGQSTKLLSSDRKLSAEEERIQKLLRIRVWQESSSSWQEMMPSDLLYEMGLYREYRHGLTTLSGNPSRDACLGDVDVGQPGIYLSAAIAMGKIARSIVPVEVRNASGQLVLTVPPQEHTTRVGLYYAARINAYRALGAVVTQLRNTARSLTLTCNAENQIQGGQFAEIFGLAYDQYVDATNGAIESSIIAGDLLRAKAPSEQEGRIWQYSAAEFSRTSAALLITGRSNTIYDEHHDPFCASAPLTPTQRRALAFIRAAGPNPADILNSAVSTGSLVGGPSAVADPGAAPIGGTLSDRLTSLLPLPLLDEPGADLLSASSLSLKDFAAARTHVAREVTNLWRSTTITLETSGSAEFPRFAATASDGTTLPAIAYAAMARESYWGMDISELPNPGDVTAFDGLEIQRGSAPGLDEFNTIVFRTIRQILPEVDTRISAVVNAELQTRLRNELRAPLVSLLDRVGTGAWGAIHQWYSNDTTLTFDVMTRGPRELFLIRGMDGLRCLMDGRVEGAQCNLSDYVMSTQTVLRGWTTGSLFGHEEVLNYSFAPGNHPGGFIFLVDRTSGHPEVVFGTYWARQPGPGRAGGWTLIKDESTRRVAEILAVSPELCSQTESDCMGEKVVAKLPLENELSQDESDVESSWKHYLELARQAAGEAELRAKEYLESGIEVERRREEIWKDRDTRARNATEQLQEICGTAMDPRKLLDYLRGTGVPQPNATTCSQSSQCNAFGQLQAYQCLAGQCVIDFNLLTKSLKSTDPELERLAQCLSSEVVSFASPGDLRWTPSFGPLARRVKVKPAPV